MVLDLDETLIHSHHDGCVVFVVAKQPMYLILIVLLVLQIYQSPYSAHATGLHCTGKLNHHANRF